MELSKKLELIGLTKGEARVYLALLSGEKTKSGIVKTSGVSSSVVYEILEKLIRKGIASSMVVEGKRQFEASSPERLLEMVEKEKKNILEKEKAAAEIISLLKNRKSEKLLFASVYEGLNGLKSILSEIENELEKEKPAEWLAMGVTASKSESFNRFWLKWHGYTRPKYRLPAKFIFSEKNTAYSKALAKTPLSEVKYLTMKKPSCITVIGERVIIMKYTSPPSFISIKSPELAKTFEEVFGIIWNC